MKISIITATYNSEATIRDTIESVLSQTYQDYEHIIVDGLSSDNTMRIVKEFAPRYNGRIKIISEKDNGIYDAMNKGIRMASGDIIGILNSDDFYRDNMVLHDIANNIEDNDAVYGDLIYVDAKNTNKDLRLYSSKGFKLWKFKLGLMPAHPTFYCRKDVYKKCGEYLLNLPIAADFDFIMRAMYTHRIKTKYIQRNFISMRIGGASTSGIKSYIQSLNDRRYAFKKNNIKTNYFLLGIGYTIKIWQILKIKIKH